MASKLYVGGLPFAYGDEDLKKMFEAHGTVESAVIIIDKFSNRSKGFGFVELSSQEEAQAAIDALHESDLDGRKLTVDHARPPRER